MEADALAMRRWLCGLLDWREASAVLDVGCGDGGDLRRIAALAPPSARLVGVDSSAKAIEAARAATASDARFAWHPHDVSRGLPFADAEFDAVFSLNLLECVPDRAALVAEMAPRPAPRRQGRLRALGLGHADPGRRRQGPDPPDHRGLQRLAAGLDGHL